MVKVAILTTVLVKYLPSWFPFHRKAAYGRSLLHKNMLMPLSRVRAEMVDPIVFKFKPPHTTPYRLLALPHHL